MSEFGEWFQPREANGIIHPDGFGGSDEGSHYMSQWRVRSHFPVEVSNNALEQALAVPVEDIAETAARIGAMVMLVITCGDGGARAAAVLEALGYEVNVIEVKP